MALPDLTPQQRAENLERALRARQMRAQIRARLTDGEIGISEVIALAERDDDLGSAVAKMKVSALLEGLPGVGSVRSAHILERLGIAPSRRLRGLGPHQRERLIAEFA